MAVLSEHKRASASEGGHLCENFHFFAGVPVATECTKHCQVRGSCIGGSVWRAFTPDCAVVFIIIGARSARWMILEQFQEAHSWQTAP